MANIIFNNKNYDIDNSAFSTYSSLLQQHLSTVMNGTGAVINLGGTAYNVDSAKLATAKDAFVQHLGAIAGSGRKVVIGGVEYGIDAVKVAGAVSDLEAVLGGSISGGSGGSGSDGEDAQPEKNKYGFYFNVPYVGEYNSDDYSYTYAYVFYDDGTVVTFCDGSSIGCGDNDTALYYSYDYTIDYNNLADSGFAFSEDGKTVLDYDGVTCTAQGIEHIEHGVYFGETYISQDGDTLVPYASDRVIFTSGGEHDEQNIEGWQAKGHFGQNYAYRIYVTVDGSAIHAGNRYDVLKTYYLDVRPKLETPVVSIVNETLNIEPVLNAEAYEVYCENTLLTTTSTLTVDLSQYIAEKNTYLLVRAVGDEYKPSDPALVRYGAEFIAGLYKTGAAYLYEAGDYTAIEDMLVTSWGELVIGEYVIQEDTSLIKIPSVCSGDLIMPKGIVTIGNGNGGYVSRYNKEITSIVLPDGLTTIGSWAFGGIENMSTVIIPDSVSNIGAAAFNDCYSLTNVIIPDGITSLENLTFGHCSALTTVSLPDSVTHIGRGAFEYCNQLENIIYRGTMEQWGAIELYVGQYATDNWNYQVPATHVQCSDGTVEL